MSNPDDPLRHEIDSIDMLLRDHAKLREAGFELAVAATRVVRDYDGLHRLSIAISGWFVALANQGDRPHAQGIEAGTAATVKQGAVHESPVRDSECAKGLPRDPD